MLNYATNERRRLGRPLKRLLDEAETGLLRPNSLHMMMMVIMIMNFTLVQIPKTKFDRNSLTFCEIKNCGHKTGRYLRNI